MVKNIRIKQSLTIFLLVLFFLSASSAKSYALIVHDPIHTAVNELQNAILQSEWAKEIALALEHLNELRTQTLELLRFHSGLDEILGSVIGEPFRNLVDEGRQSLRDAFTDYGLITPQIEIMSGSGGPEDIRSALDEMTGQIPDTDAKPYLVFDEMQVTDAFDLARQIRQAGEATRQAADEIANQAKDASPKGALRLQAEASSKLMVLNQQYQEAIAKLIELEATQIEQVTREEKRTEREKFKFLEDVSSYSDGVVEMFKGIAN